MTAGADIFRYSTCLPSSFSCLFLAQFVDVPLSSFAGQNMPAIRTHFSPAVPSPGLRRAVTGISQPATGI